jgi:hypothetical protein
MRDARCIMGGGLDEMTKREGVYQCSTAPNPGKAHVGVGLPIQERNGTWADPGEKEKWTRPK